MNREQFYSNQMVYRTIGVSASSLKGNPMLFIQSSVI